MWTGMRHVSAREQELQEMAVAEAREAQREERAAVPDRAEPPREVTQEQIDQLNELIVRDSEPETLPQTDSIIEEMVREADARARPASIEQSIERIEGNINAAIEETKKLIEGDTAVPVAPEKPPRTCIIEQALPSSVIQLLQAAPHNETVRAVVLAHVHVPIPKEHVTYEAIKEWLETTIVRGVPKPPVNASGQALTAQPERVFFSISAEEEEYGTCRYSVRLVGTGDVPIPLEDFKEMMESADDLDELRSAVGEYIEDHWSEHLNLSEDDDGPSHSRQERHGSEDSSWEHEGNIMTKLRQLVREHGDEDTRERLR